MQNFGDLVSDVLSSVSEFLLTEPICWFVGLIVLFYIAALVRYIMTGERR